MDTNDTINVHIEYPRSHGKPRFVEVGLLDVRAADNIRISYDFRRDGWKIEQASKFSWVIGEAVDYDWKEVAFVEAWARAESEKEEAARHATFEKTNE